MRVLRQQPPDRIDVAAMNSDGKLKRPRVIGRDLHAGRLIAHGHQSSQQPRAAGRTRPGIVKRTPGKAG